MEKDCHVSCLIDTATTNNHHQLENSWIIESSMAPNDDSVSVKSVVSFYTSSLYVTSQCSLMRLCSYKLIQTDASYNIQHISTTLQSGHTFLHTVFYMYICCVLHSGIETCDSFCGCKGYLWFWSVQPRRWMSVVHTSHLKFSKITNYNAGPKSAGKLMVSWFISLNFSREA